MSPLGLKLGRDMRRHRAQFLAIAVTVFLGVAMFVASYDSYMNLRASYAATHSEFRFANVTFSGGDVAGMAGTAQDVAGVESLTLRTVADNPLDIEGVKMLGRVVGLPVGGRPDVNKLKLLDGSFAMTGGAVLVEEHLAEHFELAPGDTIRILVGTEWESVQVGGVVSSPEYIWPARNRQELITTPDNFGVVFVPESLAQEAAGSGPNELAVYFDDGDERPEVVSELVDMGSGFGVVSHFTRAEQASNAALEEDIKGLEEMAAFFPLLFLTAAGLASYVMISRFVHGQRPHIGVMLANGMSKGRVLRHYLSYGIIPALVAAIPGAVAGALLARLITRLYTGMLSIPVTLVDVYPANALGGVLFGVGTAFLAALAPALVASRIKPAEAMRGETPTGGGRSSLIEALIPPLRRLPIRWRMAFRGIERNPRRTIYTILGVVLSLMLVLVSWGMIDTVNHLLDTQFQQIQQEDAVVYFTTPSGDQMAEELLGIEGVAFLELSSEVPVGLTSGMDRYDTVLSILPAETEMHRFLGSDGEWIELERTGLLVGESVAGLLEVDIGDPVELDVPALGLSLNEEISGFLDEPLGTRAYLSAERAAELTGFPPPATSALIRYEEGAGGDDLRGAVTALSGVAAFNDTKALYETAQQYMVMFYAFVGVMLLFGGAMAFALIFNAMTVNIAERRREVATLLAVGTENRTISRLITTENLIVAVLGIPVGLAAGFYLSKMAMATFSSDMFKFDLYVEPLTFVWSSVAIIIVALVSQIPGLRAVRRIDIPRIIKERSA